MMFETGKTKEYNELVRLARIGRMYKLIKLTRLLRIFKIIKDKNRLVKYFRSMISIHGGFERLIFF